MSEMTIEQAIGIMKEEKYQGTGGKYYKKANIAYDMAIKALEEKQKLSDERKAELLDGAIKAYEDRARLEVENEKLKKECQKTYNQMMEAEKDAQAEIGRLNEEIKGKDWRIQALENAMNYCAKECDRLRGQMSAVEVLEWLRCSTDDQLLEAFGDYNDDIREIINSFTPQEIIEKITEYEKSKVDASGNTTEPVSNSEEFNVGDWVKVKQFDLVRQIIEINSNHVCVMGNDGCKYSWAINTIEHAEPPKEEPQEPCNECTHAECRYCNDYSGFRKGKNKYEEEESQVEWVWECAYVGYDDSFYVKEYFSTEKEAIEYCEKFAGDRPIGYRKVCRRKV